MKRVVLTGASGFIGSHCIEFLRRQGYQIFALSSKPQVFPPDIYGLHCDLLNPVNLKECLDEAKPTHLLHLAWNVTPGQFWTSADNWTWLKASLNLLEAFADAGGKRVVMAGTCAEYDWSSLEFCERTTPCQPLSLYGTCKLALHHILEAAAKQKNLSQAWGRIFYLYGSHEPIQRFIPAVINGLIHDRSVSCSPCEQIRDFLHVSDVADAFCQLLESNVQGAVNIGSGQGVALKQIIEIITSILGKKELVQLGAIPANPQEPLRMIASTKRLNDELNWNPKVSLEEGLMRTIEWWKEKKT